MRNEPSKSRRERTQAAIDNRADGDSSPSDCQARLVSVSDLLPTTSAQATTDVSARTMNVRTAAGRNPGRVGQAVTDVTRRPAARGGGTAGKKVTADREQRRVGTVSTTVQSKAQAGEIAGGATAPLTTHRVEIP